MKKSLIIILIFISQVSVKGQSVFQRIERNVGLLKYSFKDSNKVFTGSGTGTLIFKPLDNTENFGYVFIITNKHVLPKFVQSKSIDFYISNIDSSDSPYSKLIIPIYQANGNFDPHVKVSTIEDLAIIEISRLMKSPVSKIKFIGIDNFATKDLLKNLVYNIGDIVFFIGYPNSFYSRNNYSPIFRTGYISSNPLKNFIFPPY